MQNSKIASDQALDPCIYMNTSEKKDGKFYLRHLSISLISKRKWNEKILYTEDSELDATFLKQLRDQSKTLENLETKDK